MHGMVGQGRVGRAGQGRVLQAGQGIVIGYCNRVGQGRAGCVTPY